MNGYSEPVLLRTCNCDMNWTWRPSAILESMQETAGGDCARLGVGRAVTDAMGIVWVLSRCRVELRRAPRLGEKIDVQTFAMSARHLFFPRMHVFRDAAGETVGGAYSLWLLMDLNTRRVVKSEAVLAHLPDNSDETPPTAAPGTVRPPEGDVTEGALTPVYCDFDINGHVNNTRYLDWCCNALGVEALADKYIAAFDVNYESEIRPGVAIRTELARTADGFTFCGFADGKRCFAIGGTLAAR